MSYLINYVYLLIRLSISGFDLVVHCIDKNWYDYQFSFKSYLRSYNSTLGEVYSDVRWSTYLAGNQIKYWAENVLRVSLPAQDSFCIRVGDAWLSSHYNVIS